MQDHSHGKFFFSSRRRHTRWPRDWSSDVCSSDLSSSAGTGRRASTPPTPAFGATSNDGRAGKSEIGRASCRERVDIQEVVGTMEEKNETRRGLCEQGLGSHETHCDDRAYRMSGMI